MFYFYKNNNFILLFSSFFFSRLKKMADLTGPTASFIKLVSSDDHEFIIRKDVALTSGHEREKY